MHRLFILCLIRATPLRSQVASPVRPNNKTGLLLRVIRVKHGGKLVLLKINSRLLPAEFLTWTSQGDTSFIDLKKKAVK